MIKKLLACFALAASVNAHAQTLEPTVMATSGDYYSSPNASLSWTLGEVSTETYSTPTHHLTQGFQQPDIFVIVQTEELEAVKVNVFPNPSAEMLNVTFPQGEKRSVKLEITDMNGRTIHVQEAEVNGAQALSMNIASLAAGQYLLRVKDISTGKQSTYQVQKNK